MSPDVPLTAGKGRVWAVDADAVRAFAQEGATNRAWQMLSGRTIRYRECRLARRGRDADDGWWLLTDTERDTWADRARDDYATAAQEWSL